MPFLRLKNTATYVFMPVLEKDTRVWKASPTIAAGDIKIATVATDGTVGAEANPTGTPSVEDTYWIKIPLTADETNGVATLIRLHDAAGDEWDDTGDVVYTAQPGTGGGSAVTATVDIGFTAEDIIDGVIADLAPSLPDGSGYFSGAEKTQVLGYDDKLDAIQAKTDTITITGGKVEASVEAISSAMQDLIKDLVFGSLTDSGNHATELAARPGDTPTLYEIAQWLYQRAANKEVASDTAIQTYKGDGSTVASTASITDGGTNITRGEFS